ncbi:MAG: hypothetical protein JXQ29_17725 [Planctomycetes bacterium]|nr:hypothetical protein [Planctomycetota bacterium]
MRKTAFLVAILLLAGLVTAQPSFITTTFASNNSGSTDWVNMFDVNIINASGLQILSLDLNISSTSTFAIAVYVTPNTYVGNDGNPAVWKKVSQGTGVGKGTNVPAPVDVSDFILTPGSYGMGIHYTGTGMAYTNGTGTNQNYQNADIALQLGLVRGGFFTGTVFTPRVWNGTIYYIPAVTLAGSGSGAPGTNLDFALSAGADAGLGYQMGSSFGNGPIPIDSRKLELSLDDLLVLSASSALPAVFQNYAGVLDASGKAAARLSIPNVPALKGIRIYTAFVTLKATAPSGIASISNTFLFTIQ